MLGSPAPVSDEAKTAPTQLLGAIAQPRVADVVAERIVSAIRLGQLKPGDRLPGELELARQFEVARTSVREGLQKLQGLGLISVAKGRGAFVSDPGEVEARHTFARWSAERRFAIEELLETRMSIEATAAALAAERAGDADIAALRESHLDVVEAAASGDIDALVRADDCFHETLLVASQNRLLAKIYRLLTAEITEFRRKTLALAGAPDRAIADHGAILAAVQRRDPTAARKQMIDHLFVLYEEVREAATSQGGPAGEAAFEAVGRDALE